MTPLYLLDTSVVVEFFRNNRTVIDRLFGKQAALCSIVIGELQFGARKAINYEVQRQKIESLRQSLFVYPCDEQTAEHYGIIKAALQSKGKPIPDNDIWIAAVALQYNLILATRDNHFTEVNDLDFEKW